MVKILDYLIRIEEFGGVIFNLKNFKRIEINKDEVIFLKTLELCGNKEIAKKITQKYNENYVIDFDKYEKIGLINNLVCNSKKNDYITTKQKIEEKINYVNNSNHLISPLEMTIYPTLKCNLDCRFCFISNLNSNIYEEKNADYWIGIIREAYENDVLSISILGGEPTLYYDIDKLLYGINKIGIITTITTNASMIRDSTFNIIVNSKNITPVISLQCLSDKNESLMGTKSSEQVNLIKRFREKGKKVRLNSVYTEQTFNEIYDLLDFAIDVGIDRISFATYFGSNPQNNLSCNHNFNDSRELDEKIYEYIINKYGEEVINYAVEGCMLFTAYPEIEKEMKYLSTFDKQYYGCRAGKSKLEIFPDGTVMPCVLFQNNAKCNFKISHNNFKDTWKYNKFLNELRDIEVENESCDKCGFKEICKGGCPAEKMDIYGENYKKQRDKKCVRY